MPPTPHHVELVDTAIDLNRYLELLSDADAGAHGWFLGVTRRSTMIPGVMPQTPSSMPRVRITQTLHYQAHHAMALAQMNRIAAAAVERFGLKRLVLVHRLGEVAIGQASVLVGCSSAHRRDTFAAQAWVMDELKRDVPIWKQEVYADGTVTWVHPVEASQPGKDR